MAVGAEEPRPIPATAWVGDGTLAERVRSTCEATWTAVPGMGGALAFPVGSADGVLAVVEVCITGELEPDEDLLHMLASIGSEIGQFVEHEKTEEALTESERLYHSLVENLPLSVFRKDTEGRFTFANERVGAGLGRRLDQILGRTDAELCTSPRRRSTGPAARSLASRASAWSASTNSNQQVDRQIGRASCRERV